MDFALKFAAALLLFAVHGYSPTVQQVVATPGNITYMSTTFNEASSGTDLSGTTPATCGGCSGGWSLSGGTDFTYQSGGGVSTSTANTTAYDILDIPSTNNYIVRWTITTCSSNPLCQVVVRYTNSSNFIALNIQSTTDEVKVYDVVSGTGTQVGAASLAGGITGNYSFEVVGTSWKLITPGLATPATGSTNQTGNYVGIGMNTAGTFTLSAMSVSSQ